jgi:hypothetical protein
MSAGEPDYIGEPQLGTGEVSITHSLRTEGTWNARWSAYPGRSMRGPHGVSLDVALEWAMNTADAEWIVIYHNGGIGPNLFSEIV